jgi:hypothetical protein
MIWKTRKKDKSNSEKIWTLWKKITEKLRGEKYGKTVRGDIREKVREKKYGGNVT